MSAGNRRPRITGRVVSDAVIVVLCLGLIWQAFYEIAGATALTPPIATIAYAMELLGEADFWANVAVTFQAFALAAVISIVCGLLLGLILGLRKLFGDAAEPVLVALYTIPKVAFYPVILLFFGIGIAAEVAFGVIHGVIPIVIFTMSAVANIKPILIKYGRGLGLSFSQLMLTIAIPAALPEIFTGLRVGFSLTLIGTLLSEMFGSHAGIGCMLMNAMGLNSVKLIMSLTFLLLLFAALVNSVLLYIDTWLRHGAHAST